MSYSVIFCAVYIAMLTMIWGKETFGKPPNIILFMADDLGFSDVGCFGNRTVRTPNIDQLATDGVKFTHSLSASSVCTPSRAAFLTGRYPVRSGIVPNSYIPVSIFVASSAGLPSSELTVAEVAKQAGYSTALLGKWHLGWSKHHNDPKSSHPLNQGFDYFYGMPLTNMREFDPLEIPSYKSAMPYFLHTILCSTIVSSLTLLWAYRKLNFGKACVWTTVLILFAILTFLLINVFSIRHMVLLNSMIFRNHELVEQPVILSQVTRKIVMEGEEFLTERATDGRPFLLFVSWIHVHTTLDVGPMFKGKSIHGPYGDAVEELDWGVGEIMRAVSRLNLDNNTLVYFTSDNGGHLEEVNHAGQRSGGHNKPLKGGKTHGAPDGGIRVPTVLRWPAAVSRGQVVDEPVSLMDILPTVASLLDVSLPANLHVDGRSLLPLITGKQLRSQHEFLFHYCLSYLHAVRYMPREDTRVWKLVLFEPNYLPGKDQCHFVCFCINAVPLVPPRLFEMTSDPKEQRPVVAKEEPLYDILVATMMTAIEEHKHNVISVSNAYMPWSVIWRPWDQPFCKFPKFRCSDAKFDAVFGDNDNFWS